MMKDIGHDKGGREMFHGGCAREVSKEATVRQRGHAYKCQLDSVASCLSDGCREYLPLCCPTRIDPVVPIRNPGWKSCTAYEVAR